MEDWGRVELQAEQEDDPTAGRDCPGLLSRVTPPGEKEGGYEKVGKMMRSAKTAKAKGEGVVASHVP